MQGLPPLDPRDALAPHGRQVWRFRDATIPAARVGAPILRCTVSVRAERPPPNGD